MNDRISGRLIIISGPSGAGKSTVVRRLLDECELPLRLSISATTREARPDEVHGQDYFFMSEEEFLSRQQAGEFLECKEVFGLGCWYGTLRDQVATGLAMGQWVILEIDVQGAIAILDQGGLDPITFFVHTGGLDSLESRLRGRKTEDEAVISRRLTTAEEEIQLMHRYRYQIINDSVDRAVDEICQRLVEHRDL